MKRALLFLSLLLFSPCLFAADTLTVYFPADGAFMTPYTQKQLDKILAELRDKDGLHLIGYADNRGDKYYNDMLSMRRAQSVAKYLQEKGIAANSIKVSIGKGEISRWESERNKHGVDRRVDIVFRSEVPPPPAPPMKKAVEISEKIEEVKVGETIALDNIQFQPGLPIIMPESGHVLAKLYDAMEANDSLVIQIEGHICCAPEPEGNYKGHGYLLSLSRAQAVYNYLIKREVAPERMTYKGFSRWRPLRTEITEEDRAANRRVEIRIMKK